MKREKRNKHFLRKLGELLLVSFVFLSACFVVPQVEVNATTNSDTNKSLFILDGENTNIEPSDGNDGDYKDDWKGHYIYWGEDTSKKWQILDTNSTEYTTSDGLLILSGSLGKTIFAPREGGSSYYDESTLQKYVDSSIDNLLTDAEYKAILKSTNWHGDWQNEITKIDGRPYVEGQFKNYRYFAPPVKMLIDANYGFRTSTSLSDFDYARVTNMDKDDKTKMTIYWTGALVVNGSGGGATAYQTAAYVYYTPYFGLQNIWYDQMDSRAALNIDPTKIFFVSDAETGKADTVLPIIDTTSKEWQLTLKDDTQKLTVTNVKKTGETTIAFDYRKEGKGNTISAFIKDESGNIIQYGKVTDIKKDVTSGRATLELPSNFFTDKYTLHVFSEVRNGNKMTDYASDSVKIENIPSDVTLEGGFLYKTDKGADVSTYKDYISNATYTEPVVAKNYKIYDSSVKKYQNYRFDKWSYDVEDAIVEGSVVKSFVATAQYVKTFTVVQLDEDYNETKSTVDINTDLTAPVENGGIGLVEPTKEGYVFAGWKYLNEGADVKNVTMDFYFQPIFEYPIENNKDWTLGSTDNLSIKAEAPYDDFVKVIIDDVTVNKSNYTVKQGSTIVELNSSYLETLSVGIHKLAIEFTNLSSDITTYSTTNIEIKKKDIPVEPEKPEVPDKPDTPGTSSGSSGSSGTISVVNTLIDAVKAIDEVKAESEFTAEDIYKIVAAKNAYDKLTGEGNPYKLTTKKLQTVKSYEATINKLYAKLGIAGTVTGKGWIDLGNGDWNYYNEDGSASTKWVAAGTYWYYVKDGRMLRNAWIAQDATGYIWYYVDNEGKMVVNTTIDTYSINANGEWYNQ